MRRVYVLDVYDYETIDSKTLLNTISSLVELNDSTGIMIGTISSKNDKFSIIQNKQLELIDIDFLLEFRRRFWVITTFKLINGEVPDLNDGDLQPKIVTTDNGPRPALLFFNNSNEAINEVAKNLEEAFLNFEFDGLTNNELKEEFLKMLGKNHCIFIHKNQFYIPEHVKCKTSKINSNIDKFEYYLI